MPLFGEMEMDQDIRCYAWVASFYRDLACYLMQRREDEREGKP